MANRVPFQSWLAVRHYCETHAWIYYQAPLDHHPVVIAPKRIFKNGKIRFAYHDGRFTADASHLSRFSRPEPPKHPLIDLYKEGRLHPFGVTINTVAYRHYCPKHSDGMGFMYADSCPDCTLTPAGWEAWGSNGHKQGSGPDRASLLAYMRYHAYRTWKAEHSYGPGHHLRMVFKRGGRIIYLG